MYQLPLTVLFEAAHFYGKTKISGLDVCYLQMLL